jgi:hypothetical protein
MVQNELVHGGANEVGPTCRGKLTTEGFYVYRMPRADKGVQRGPREVVKPAKPVKASKVKRGPGRPRVYDGSVRRTIASFLKKYGYTHGLKLLKKERKIKVSKTVARSVAEEVGITFKRGRPAA